jgi:hypothetical protein
MRAGWSGGAALTSGVLLAQLAALLLGGAAPDAGVLVGGEGELEAVGWASHWRQTALAFSICSMAGPVVPTGKNRSGSVSRQAAVRRHSSDAMVSDSR